MSDVSDVSDVSDEDTAAAMVIVERYRDARMSVSEDTVREILANDRARQAKCTCGAALIALCGNCDEDALDGMGSQ